jgi:hypothetical protein
MLYNFFTAVIYEFSSKARVFVRGRSFQTSLMFVDQKPTIFVEYLKGGSLRWALALSATLD